MPYYESNEPYERVDGVGNGAMIGAMAGGVGGAGTVWGAKMHHKNIDARMDAKASSLEQKRSNMYEKANDISANVDEKVSRMRMNPMEAGRSAAGHAAQGASSAYYKPAYNMERGPSGDVVFDNAEDATRSRVRQAAAFDRYSSAVEGSRGTQWGRSQVDAAHASYVGRQSEKRSKLMGKANNMRQGANEMQGQINHLNDADYRSGQKANHFYGKRLGGWRNAAAIGGATAVGAISGAFLDAAATNEV